MRRPAKIVHIAWLSQVGGGELFLLDLLEAFDKEQFDHELFFLGPGGQLRQEAEDLGLRVVQFPKQTKLGPVTLLRLSMALRGARPDVVQTHGEAGVFWGITATRMARSLSRSWRPAICSLIYQNDRETAGKMYATRRLLPAADVVIAGSEAVRTFLLQEARGQAVRIKVIHCGIDTESFEAAHAGSDERSTADHQAGPILLTIGRLVERKGHAVLVRAFSQVRSIHPDAQLWLVGEGPEIEKLKQLASELQVEQQVKFLGTVYPTGSILGQADLFIFPSLVEPQGLALLEAFAAGVPVVASRTGGIVEMLEDGEHGILVQPGDPDALADAIVALLADPSRGEAYVRSARRRVEDFDIHRIAGQYESLYSELIPLSATAHGEPQR